MKNSLTFSFVWLLLLNLPLAAQERSVEAKLSDDQIVQGVSRLLRWSWYWEARPLQNYRDGEKTEMAIVESPNEIAAFLGDIGARFDFDLNGKLIGGRGFPPTSNSSAVDKYVTEYGAATDRPFLNRGDTQTLTMEEKRRILNVHTIPYTLPKLEPPESILLRLKSPELPHLKAAVAAALDGWYSPSCGPGEIMIPYFSDDDPSVNVYADLGSCGKGIIAFTHRDEGGPWKFAPFWPNKPPNDFSSVIQKIQDNAADTIQLPFRSN